MKRASATAVVEVVVEVQVGTWGDDCTVKQAEEQGAKEAVAHLTAMTREDPRVHVREASAVSVTIRSENKR